MALSFASLAALALPRSPRALPPLVPAQPATGWQGAVPFGPSQGSSTPFAMEARFRAFKALNEAGAAGSAGVADRRRLVPSPLFDGGGLQARLARALVERRCVDRKEFFETFEFFSATRSALRCGPGAGEGLLVDVAGGHGLLACLFATFEWRRFDRVLVLDTRRPASHDAILEAVASVAPWAVERLAYVAGGEADLLQGGGARHLEAGCAVACVHGCNTLTDGVLARAAEAGAHSVAVMPCCYGGVAEKIGAPPALARALGVALAADVQRTYQMEERGYAVGWRALPSAITPMNRVLVARARAPCAEERAVRGAATSTQ